MLVSFILLVASVFNLALGGVILQRLRNYDAGRYLAWFLFGVCAWLACGSIILHPQTPRDSALLAMRATYFFATGYTISWLWFCAELSPSSKPFKALAWLLTAMGVVWLFLAWTPYLVEGILRPPWSAHGEPGVLMPAVVIWYLLSMGVSFAYLLLEKAHTRGIRRLQLRYIVYGMLGWAVVAFLAAPVSFWISGSSRYGFIAMLASLVMTSSTAYAIMRSRLADTTVVLRSVLSFLITSLLMLFFFLLSAPTLDKHADALLDIPYAGACAAALVVAFTFSPLRRKVLGVLSRKVFKGVPDYRAILQDIGAIFSSVSETKELVTALEKALLRSLRPQKVAVYLSDSNGHMVRHPASGSWAQLPERLEGFEAILAAAGENDGVVLQEECARSPQRYQDTADQLRALDACAAVPMQTAFRYCGLILLKEKRSKDGCYTADDITMLSIIAKQAAITLDNAFRYDELRELNEELERRVFDRTHQLAVLNQQLAIANQELKEADRAKDEFLAILSHELLTPLTSILGWNRIARQTDSGETRQQAMEIINRNALRQRRVLDELVDASRILHGKMHLQKQCVDLWLLVEHSLAEHEQQMVDRDIIASLATPDNPLPVSVDPRRIIQVIGHLLTNAIKFTAAGGEVHVTAHRTLSAVVLRIQDTGRGIPQQELERVFNPFTQYSRDETVGGLGLGLTVAKGIVELHGGHLTAFSPGKGKGTTFTVTLPLAHVARHAPVESSDEILANWISGE